MYLMDALTTAAAHSRITMKREPILKIYSDLAEKLVGTPRFIFENSAIHTAVELTLGRPKVMLEAMGQLRIPYTSMWVEWEEAGREKLRKTFGTSDHPADDPIRPLPGRVGYLLEVDPNGRSGQATWIWNTPSLGDVPNIGAINALFNLDKTFPQSRERIESFLRGNLGKLWADNQIQKDALLGIWRTGIHVPSDWGKLYFDVMGGGPGVIAHSFADVYGEYIMIWATLMLLTASRQIVSYEAIHLDRLNKARRKKGEVPRLDHTKVTLHISTPKFSGAGAPLNFIRKSPRVHMVSSYLARRGNRHWIVQPYWRGQGETISKHTKVRV